MFDSNNSVQAEINISRYEVYEEYRSGLNRKEKWRRG